MTSVCDEERGDVPGACDRCLARTWLLEAVSGHLDRVRAEIDALLALDEQDLIAAVGGRRRDQLRNDLAKFDGHAARREAERASLELICRCDAAYPDRLRELPAPPAVLHVAGSLDRFLAGAGTDPVAVVGARAASPYGTGIARSLGRGLAAAGLTVVSGMASGIDAAAQAGALGARRADGELTSRDDEPPPTVAVLPASADRPYPKANRRLYRELLAAGAAVSELPPGTRIRSWMFPARNRIIAGLAEMTVVVEAGRRSGSLVTARLARELGRPVCAVPGRVTSPQSTGSNALLKDGAALVRGAQDVLDQLFEAGSRVAPVDYRPRLSPELSALLQAIGAGHDTAGALNRRGLLGERGLAALATLELSGYIRREAGGRYGVVP
jgi:DNA processing protein